MQEKEIDFNYIREQVALMDFETQQAAKEEYERDVLCSDAEVLVRIEGMIDRLRIKKTSTNTVRIVSQTVLHETWRTTNFIQVFDMKRNAVKSQYQTNSTIHILLEKNENYTKNSIGNTTFFTFKKEYNEPATRLKIPKQKKEKDPKIECYKSCGLSVCAYGGCQKHTTIPYASPNDCPNCGEYRAIDETDYVLVMCWNCGDDEHSLIRNDDELPF